MMTEAANNEYGLKAQFVRFSLRIKGIRAVAFIALVYLASYLVLMDRQSPAVVCAKGKCEVSFDSSFRYATYPGDIPTEIMPWNLLFFPLDCLYFSVWPGQRKYGERRIFDETDFVSKKGNVAHSAVEGPRP